MKCIGSAIVILAGSICLAWGSAGSFTPLVGGWLVLLGMACFLIEFSSDRFVQPRKLRIPEEVAQESHSDEEDDQRNA